MVSAGVGAGGSCTVVLLSVCAGAGVAACVSFDALPEFVLLLPDDAPLLLDFFVSEFLVVCSGVVPSNALSPVA